MRHSYLLLAAPTILVQSVTAQFATGQSLGTVGSIHDLEANDVNGDGHIDLVAASYDGHDIVWLPSSGGSGSYGAAQVIANGLAFARSLEIGDLNGDGLADIVATGSVHVVWLRRIGPAQFAPAVVLSSNLQTAEDCAVGDLDGDSDLDVVVVSFYDDKVTWFQNLGAGSFAVGVTISTAGDGPAAVRLGDLDGDGRLDIAVTSLFDDEVNWYRNLGGGAFGQPMVITSTLDGAYGLVLADLDANGRLDVVSTGSFGGRVVLFRGLGAGLFSAEVVLDLAVISPRHATAADVDLDGDLDLVASIHDSNDVRLYENTGMGSFAGAVSLAPAGSSLPIGSYRPLVLDADGDTDNDILTGAILGHTIHWFQNLTALGTTYCSSNPNSSGATTALEVTGSVIAGLNRMALTARDMPPSSAGYFLASRTAGMVSMPAGSSGVLCLSGAIGRYVGPGQAGFSGAARRIRLVLDLPRTPTPTGLIAIMPGETWHFQAWHHDVVAGVMTSNFSNAVRVAFQ